jgi:hypothetical protein
MGIAAGGIGLGAAAAGVGRAEANFGGRTSTTGTSGVIRPSNSRSAVAAGNR